MKILQILLFLLLAVPGSLIFVFASISLIGKVLDPKADLPDSYILLLACVVGIIATLIGIGKYKQWLYSFVFIAFPLVFWLWALINPNMLGGSIAMLGFICLSVFGVFKAVQYYYGNQQVKK